MDGKQELSINTREYLVRFQQILNEMICKMTSAKLTDSISNNFIVQMIPHHMAAIEMSQNILRVTTDVAVQNIAMSIVEEQTKSIENMRRVQEECSLLTNSPWELCRYQTKMDSIMETMFRGMRCACNDNRIDADFMREMIPHHRGAVEMCENTLGYDICPGLCPILRAIISSQKRGIAQMQCLLRCY